MRNGHEPCSNGTLGAHLCTTCYLLFSCWRSCILCTPGAASLFPWKTAVHHVVKCCLSAAFPDGHADYMGPHSFLLQSELYYTAACRWFAHLDTDMHPGSLSKTACSFVLSLISSSLLHTAPKNWQTLADADIKAQCYVQPGRPLEEKHWLWSWKGGYGLHGGQQGPWF